MYMLVYRWVRNYHLIILREEFPARKPSLPTAGGKCPHPLPPRRHCRGWGRAQQLPRPCQLLQDPKEGPQRGTATLEAILAGCSKKQVTLPHTAITRRGSLLGGREGRGKQAVPPFFFVCNWERLQAQSLKSFLRCSRAKVNSLHDRTERQNRFARDTSKERVSGPLVPVSRRVNNPREWSPPAAFVSIPRGGSGLLPKGRRRGGEQRRESSVTAALPVQRVLGSPARTWRASLKGTLNNW